MQSDGTEREITLGASTITYQVTVQSVDGSNKYFINGTQQETLSLTEGNTYIFDWSSATGHPLKFSETSDGTHASGTEYTTGVTVDESNYKTTIVVAANAPNLFYYCSNHSGMGGTANTPNASGSLDNEGESGSSGGGESGSSGGGGGGTPTTSTFVIPFRKSAYFERRELNQVVFEQGVMPSGQWENVTATGTPSSTDVTNGGKWFYRCYAGKGRWETPNYQSRPRFMVATFNFPNISVANAATINSAKLKLTSLQHSSSTGVENYKIAAVLVDDGSIFHMPIGKGTTVAWSNLSAASQGTQLESPDIKDIIQEIVNLPAWRSGNGITLYVYYELSIMNYNSEFAGFSSGYNSDGTTISANNDGTSRVPELVIEHVGGSDTGTIVEADDTLQLLGNASGSGQFLRSNNATYDNSGSYSSIRTSHSAVRGGFEIGVENMTLSNSDTLTFGSWAIRFPNIQIAQGATVPTTKLSFYTFHDHLIEPPYYSTDRAFLTRKATGHTLESGHHALNGDGTNDAVGFRLRALNRDNIPSDFSTLGTTDFDHPQGLSNTGTSDMTSAYIDIPFSSIMTEATSYGAKGNIANIVTADIKSIIQEVVNRSGWSSGNDIALFIYLPQSYSSASGSDSTNSNIAKQDYIKMTVVRPNIDSASTSIYDEPSGMMSYAANYSALNASTKKNLGREPKLIIG